MYEESQSFEALKSASPGQQPERAQTAGLRRTDTALRAIAWCELTARLEAARDLRLALRDDARGSIADDGASFRDAAAKYFRSLEHGQQPVNLAALGKHNGSDPTIASQESSAVGDTADALSDRDEARDEQ